MVVAPSRFLQKAAKSCSPSSGSAAAFMASTSSVARPVDDVAAGERVARAAVAQPVDVAPLERGEARVEPRWRCGQGDAG